MRRDQDPFELIKQGDPAPREQMPDALSPLGRAIRERALTAHRQPQPTRTRTRTVVTAILVAALALAVAAAAWLITREASEPRGVACYEEPHLEATQVVVMAPDRLDTSECEPLWEDGTLASGGSVADPFEVPPLIGCVTDAGGLAVFPSDNPQLCQSLGLAGHEPSPSEDLTTLLNQQLLAIFSNERCLSVEYAQGRIEDLLAGEDFGDWTLGDVVPGPAERPCASFSLDVAAKVILLVPVPEPPAGEQGS